MSTADGSFDFHQIERRQLVTRLYAIAGAHIHRADHAADFERKNRLGLARENALGRDGDRGVGPGNRGGANALHGRCRPWCGVGWTSAARESDECQQSDPPAACHRF
jgi:hypothetical protein